MTIPSLRFHPFTLFLVLAVSALAITACTFGPENSNSASSSSAGSSVASAASALISVSQPVPNSVITSPLTVTGEARGYWYFEASFPVKLFDGNGQEVALTPGYAEAQGDWMTEDFVPFTATLTFTPPATATGTLVLQKDNPSGEPQNDASISIPVQF